VVARKERPHVRRGAGTWGTKDSVQKFELGLLRGAGKWRGGMFVASATDCCFANLSELGERERGDGNEEVAYSKVEIAALRGET
jgi:hypothetical protein